MHHLRYLLLGALLFTAGPLWSADNPVPQDGDLQESADAAQGSPGDEVVLDEDSVASDSGDEASEEESPGRFIPTEEISQDLGVSFPVDI